MNTFSTLTLPARLWRNGDILPGTLQIAETGVSFLSPSGSQLLDDGEIPLRAIEAALPYNTFLFIRNGLILHLVDGSTVQLTLDRRKDALALLNRLHPTLGAPTKETR